MADKNMITISASGLGEFLACPRKYYYGYMARIQAPDDKDKTGLKWLEANEKGNLVHKAMQLYVDEVILPISQKLGTDEAPKDSDAEKEIIAKLDALDFDENVFQDIWKRAVEYIEKDMQKGGYDEPVVVPLTAKEKELSENEEDMRRAVKNLIQKMKENRQYPICAEMPFGTVKREGEEEPAPEMVMEREGSQFALRGFIDRVDYDVSSGKFVVIDYKSGKIENKSKLRQGDRDDLLQDWIYALAFEKLFPDREVVSSRYIFTSSNNREITAEMTKENKKQFEDRLFAEIKRIESKKDTVCKANEADFPDWVDTCKYCNYKKLCEAHDELNKAGDESTTDKTEAE